MIKFVRDNMKLIDFYQGDILDSGLDWGLATYKAIEKPLGTQDYLPLTP